VYILPGCVLPWKENAKRHIPADGSDSMIMDGRGTSCFVIKFGVPSELIAQELWNEHGKVAFASSALPALRLKQMDIATALSGR